MDCTIRIAKTKALISFAVTAKLICVFVFAYANNPVFLQRGSFIPFNFLGTSLMSYFELIIIYFEFLA